MICSDNFPCDNSPPHWCTFMTIWHGNSFFHWNRVGKLIFHKAEVFRVLYFSYKTKCYSYKIYYFQAKYHRCIWSPWFDPLSELKTSSTKQNRAGQTSGLVAVKQHPILMYMAPTEVEQERKLVVGRHHSEEFLVRCTNQRLDGLTGWPADALRIVLNLLKVSWFVKRKNSTAASSAKFRPPSRRTFPNGMQDSTIILIIIHWLILWWWGCCQPTWTKY